MYDTVSVVVPVYNVEKYIKECLDSIVNQTYKDLQIILVDDGSTDNSGYICDEYAKKDSRITVVHQKNAGAGAAKNTGLDLVSGKYFMIIDSDDYLDVNAVEFLLDTMSENKVDVVQYLLSYTYTDGEVECPNLYVDHDNKKISSDAFLLGLLGDWKYAIFANKLFKTELLKDIRFYVGNAIDDEFFTYKVICNSENVFISNKQLYYYRMRKSSVMNDNKQDRLISDRTNCFVERYNYIKECRPKLGKRFYEHLSDILLFYKTQTTNEELHKKLDELIKIYSYKKPGIINRLFRKSKKTISMSTDNGFVSFD